MEGLVSLLLFAGLFYFMMRFGCGAHMVHGHGHHGGHGSAAPAKDPVCGMSVEPNQGYAKMHKGQEYRFCSRKCLDQFEAEPGRYTTGKGVQS
ncbi:MAG: YHS domain-containing protein [Bryobacteraceae bacterium]